MKIHTDNISYATVRQAAAIAGVDCIIEARGSRKRDHAFEVALSGSSRYATESKLFLHPVQGATWDEWGVFIDALFTAEPTAIIGQYKSRNDFLDQTSNAVATWKSDSKAPWLA